MRWIAVRRERRVYLGGAIKRANERIMADTTNNSIRWATLALIAFGVVGAGLLLYQIGLMQQQITALRATDRQQLFWTVCQPAASVEERTAAFRQLVADGHEEWRSANLNGLELRGSTLDGAKLRLADLTAVDLREASLVETDLAGTRLRTADLSDADLSEATLDGADMLKAILDGADLDQARMLSTSLEQTSARGARFVLADMSDAILLMADMTDADFTGANLTGATLESARLNGATLVLTNLTEADLTGTDLTDANWWRARGLSQSQLFELATEFPPSEAAEPSRAEDFLIWVDSSGFMKSAAAAETAADTGESE